MELLLFGFKLADSCCFYIITLEGAKLSHMRLIEVDLLMVLRFPYLDEHKLARVGFGIVVIISFVIFVLG